MIGSTGVGFSEFGTPTVPILLDEVRCEGEESRLIDCLTDPFGQHDCSEFEGAGVVCTLTSECILVTLAVIFKELVRCSL